MNRTESLRLQAEAQSRTRSHEKAWLSAHPADAVLTLPSGSWDRRSIRDRVREAVAGREVPERPVPRWQLARALADVLRPLSAETIHEHLSALASERKRTKPAPERAPKIAPEPQRPAEDEKMSVREFLDGEIAAGRLDLAEHVTEAEKRRLARAHGCTASRIGQVLADLRKAAEKQRKDGELEARQEAPPRGEVEREPAGAPEAHPFANHDLLGQPLGLPGMPKATEVPLCEMCGERPQAPDDLWCAECNAAEHAAAENAPKRTDEERALAAAQAEAVFYRTQCEAAVKGAAEREATLNAWIDHLQAVLDSSAAATRAAEAERDEARAYTDTLNEVPKRMKATLCDLLAQHGFAVDEDAPLSSLGTALRRAETYREALEHYANDESWDDTGVIYDPSSDDGGYDRARQALGGTRTIEVKAAGALCDRGHLYGADRETCPVCELAEARARIVELAREKEDWFAVAVQRGDALTDALRECDEACAEAEELRAALSADADRDYLDVLKRYEQQAHESLTAVGVPLLSYPLPDRVRMLTGWWVTATSEVARGDEREKAHVETIRRLTHDRDEAQAELRAIDGVLSRFPMPPATTLGRVQILASRHADALEKLQTQTNAAIELRSELDAVPEDDLDDAATRADVEGRPGASAAVLLRVLKRGVSADLFRLGGEV